jgi:hypothetical protein
MTEEEFHQKAPEWIRADKKDWNIITIVGYFCVKYEQKHEVRYRITKSKLGPTSSKEMKDFSKLFAVFAPEDYKELGPSEKSEVRENVNRKIYNYINWMFDYKFRSGDRSVSGTQIFLMPSMINEFERMYSSYLKKVSTKSSFETFFNIIKSDYPQFLDRNELSSLDDLLMIYKIWIQKGKMNNEDGKVISIALKMGLINEK